jgi:aryl-alcohol dehydrogenase-like predicted oxidoreductase
MIKKTHLGTSNLEVTRIGLGLAALGRPGYINLGHRGDLTGRTEVRALEEHAHEVLTMAFELGVRYFDAARSYGGGEEFLGRWLYKSRITDPGITISSKWGYRYVADWRVDAEVHEIKDHSLAMLNTQYEETRSRLGRHVDIYQIHSATLESGVLDDDDVLDRLAELRADGLTIGLSTSGPGQAETIRKAMGIERDGVPLFGTVQSTWNLLEPSAGEALAEAHDEGMGTIIKESVANGRLTQRDLQTTMPLREAFPDDNPDTIAVAAILAKPWVDTVLSGAATVEQLESNLDALNIEATRVAGLETLMAENPEDYWVTRSGLKWT